MIVLITGGARSGKSKFAEQYAARLGTNGIYVATAQIYDDEMADRVRRHRSRRDEAGFSWVTLEEPYHLADMLAKDLAREQAWTASNSSEGRQADGVVHEDAPLRGRGGQPEGSPYGIPASAGNCSGSRTQVVLIDCLTLWLSNWLLRFEGEPDAAERVERKIDELAEALNGYPGTVLLVSNEVGSGIVPEYPLGRLYRDLAGRMNQRIASVSRQVFLVTAGIAVELKSIAFRLD
jgi:adenosylcobinamide kinase/adenosylcobinamide-phosphate guanylyltransferase